jgi:DNA-binding winged helix-turn-helix (wHTH) protein
MHQHKGEILRRTRNFLPEDYQLIKTVPKRGFMLNLSPGMVHVIRIEPAPATIGSVG